MRGKKNSAGAVLGCHRLVNAGSDGNDDAAFLHDAVGACERVMPNDIQDDIDIFGHTFEFGFLVVDRYVRAELFE
ncbi:MAG TPA: hypothetical protein VGI85_12640 [Chthoniobacterales bacterium]|jgi:hypothetical protein